MSNNAKDKSAEQPTAGSPLYVFENASDDKWKKMFAPGEVLRLDVQSKRYCEETYTDWDMEPLAIAYMGFIVTDDEQLHLLLFETLESLKRFVQHVRPLKTKLALGSGENAAAMKLELRRMARGNSTLH